MASLTNVNLRVLLGFGSTPLEEFPACEEITTSVWGFDTSRGRSSVLDKFSAGTGTLRVNNQTGAFDPANTSSIYNPDVQLGVPVIIEVDRATVTYTVFRGMVAAYPIEYSDGGQLSNVGIPITDLTPLLAGCDLTGHSFLEELSGERVHSVLDDVGWPATWRDIDVGGGFLPAATIASGSALAHLQAVTDVEAGLFFISADGYATFRSRAGSSGLASSFTFGETAGQVRFEEITRAYDKDYLFNIVTATRPGGVPQTFRDEISVDKYGPLTLSVDALFRDDNAALGVANWQALRLAETVNRIVGLTIDPDQDATNMWPAVAGLELRDGITVQFTPPGGGTVVNQLVSVEGVDHSVTDEDWRTSYRVWPLPTVETDSYWILGESALDVDARLA